MGIDIGFATFLRRKEALSYEHSSFVVMVVWLGLAATKAPF
jgi:hypothetical protein